MVLGLTLIHIWLQYINVPRSHFCSWGKWFSKHLHSRHMPCNLTLSQKIQEKSSWGLLFFTGMNRPNQQDLFWLTLICFRFWFARTKCCGNTAKQALVLSSSKQEPVAVMAKLSSASFRVAKHIFNTIQKAVCPCAVGETMTGQPLHCCSMTAGNVTDLTLTQDALYFQSPTRCCQKYTCKTDTCVFKSVCRSRGSCRKALASMPIPWLPLTLWQSCCFPSTLTEFCFLAPA